jgi:superfamily II DNA or RNA helicase
MIIISNNVTIFSTDEEKIKYLKKISTISNPEYASREQLGLSTFVPANLNYWNAPTPNCLEVPIGLLKDVIALFPNELYEDIRFESKNFLAVNFFGHLRAEQEAAVNTLMSKKIGILEAPTGSGKTIAGISLIVRRKQPTLVLVNTIDLLEQFTERLYSFTDIHKGDVGIIASGKKKIKPVTVATLQTLNNFSSLDFEELNKYFGQVITDEVHIIGARTFYHVVSQFKAKYKIGLSATPKRDDSYTAVVFFGTGPIIHSITKDEVKNERAAITYRKIDTDYFYELMFTTDYGRMIDDLSINKERNEQIANEVKTFTGKTLILCHRVSQINALHELLPGSYVLTSLTKKTKKAQDAGTSRNSVLEAFKQDPNNSVMISTYGLFSTGLDIVELKNIVFASPTRSTIRIKQSIGRARRKYLEKIANIIDFVDIKVDLLKHQYYHRRRIVNKEMSNVPNS